MTVSRTDQRIVLRRNQAGVSFNSRRTLWLAATLWFFILVETLAAQGHTSDVQLYFFTSQGCAPCRHVEPAIETLKHEGYPVATIDLVQHSDWGKTFSVDRTPTVVMVADKRVVGRHAGIIDANTLREWFAAVGYSKAPVATSAISSGRESQKADTAQPNAKQASTIHQGTSEPSSEQERRALAATVRLKVQDNEGISYATGTVIHCREGEWLVMTCGHAFREAGYRGKITAEFNFATGQMESGPGELISYDATSRDIALVAVQAGRSIEPISLAAPSISVDRGDNVFTLGCDGGADPTIRRTKIKNSAVYDGAVKYDIIGRPAIGRSGGGLFNERGELIGVCNAAAVETDEGIYSALETLHWQVAQANLSHIFTDSANLELGKSNATPDRNPANDLQLVALHSKLESNQLKNQTAAESQSAPRVRPVNWDPSNTGVSRPRSDIRGDQSESPEKEIIIIVRPKSGNGVGESITISNPTDELLDYLKEMKDNQSDNRQVGIARMRTER